MSASTFHREVEITAAYDKRDPNPAKNYGIHGVELRFVLRGPAGAVQFLLYTNWMLPHVEKDLDSKHGSHSLCHPLPADLGYHSLRPMYESQEAQPGCPYLDGKPCYYDGSGLNAKRVYDVMVAEGGDAMWKELEAYYAATFTHEAAE
jgi:hypothetical protein